MIRWLGRILLILLILLCLVSGWVWYEFVITRGKTPNIDRKGSIASLEQISLVGVKQWVLIRGHEVSNPLILFLHGGLGMPTMYLAHAFQQELERDFVVAHWDRAGAGKSFTEHLPDSCLSVSQRLNDTIQLTRLLMARFEKDRIYLLGHSFGSYLGLLAARNHPEYYAAFIGTGQMAGTKAQVEEVQRELLIEASLAAGDQQTLNRMKNGATITENDVFRYGGELYNATIERNRYAVEESD